jgi:hypothetical protein
MTLAQPGEPGSSSKDAFQDQAKATVGVRGDERAEEDGHRSA